VARAARHHPGTLTAHRDHAPMQQCLLTSHDTRTVRRPRSVPASGTPPAGVAQGSEVSLGQLLEHRLGVETSVETRAVGVDGGPLLLSVKDAAAHLGISRGLMYELLNRGDMESLRIGPRRLVSREAINRFIETNSGSGPK
jgi:excisionase family DNA binding protein